MGIYEKLYDFAARAGALEGYVYPKEKVDVAYLPRWVDHLVEQYNLIPEEVREQFQSLCDGTVGRTIQALLPSLGEDHEVIKKLRKMVVGKLPPSYDDFGHSNQPH